MEPEATAAGAGGGGGGHFGDVYLYRIKETAEPVVLKIAQRAHDPKDLARETALLSLLLSPTDHWLQRNLGRPAPGFPSNAGARDVEGRWRP